MNKIVIKNREPQEIKIGGGGAVIGVTEVLVNGVDVTQGSIAYVVVPTKTSELDNDSGFITQETDPTIPYYIKQITQADINSWNNKQDQLISGNNIKTINGSSIMGSGNLDIDTSYTAGTGININEENVISNTITSYNDLTDLPTIPTKTSDLFNDSDYVTSSELSEVATSGDYDDLTNKPTIPTKTSELENDSGYITNRVDDLINYYDKDFLYNLLPKVSGTGSAISLDNTYKSKLELTLSPSTLEQETTTGKNKLGYPSFTSLSIGGVTFENTNGVYKIGGTTGTDNNFPIQTIDNYTIQSEDYIHYNNDFIDSHIGFTLIFSDNTNYFNSFATSTNRRFSLANYVGKTITGVRFNFNTGYQFSGTCSPMICNISSATDFEEYTGGIPAPNPSYPQDIHTISGSNTIKVEGKQLFDIENGEQGAIDSSGNYVANPWNWRAVNYISVKPSTTYTFSIDRTNISQSNYLRIYEYNSSKTFLSPRKESANRSDITFTTGSTTEYIKYVIYIDNTTMTKTLVESLLPQIEYGSSRTSYAPYTLETKDIDLDFEFCKIGNYEDRIFKNVESDPDYDESLEVGTWYLKQEIGKLVLDGTEAFGSGLTRNGFKYFELILPNTSANIYANLGGYFCNIAKEISGTNMYEVVTQENLFALYTNKIRLMFTGISTGTDLQTLLSNNNAIVYYVLSTPTYTPITGTFEDQLNSIQSTYSENEQTNISQINNDLPFQITATTLKDISNL